MELDDAVEILADVTQGYWNSRQDAALKTVLAEVRGRRGGRDALFHRLRVAAHMLVTSVNPADARGYVRVPDDLVEELSAAATAVITRVDTSGLVVSDDPIVNELRDRLAALEQVAAVAREVRISGAVQHLDAPLAALAGRHVPKQDTPCTCGLAGIEHQRGTRGCIFPAAPCVTVEPSKLRGMAEVIDEENDA